MRSNIIVDNEWLDELELTHSVIKLMYLDIRKILGRCSLYNESVSTTMLHLRLKLLSSCKHLPIVNLEIACDDSTTTAVDLESGWYGVCIRFKFRGEFAEWYGKNILVRFVSETGYLEVQ